MPILPANDHPFAKDRVGRSGKEYRGLKLDGEGRMHKVGYVKLGEVYAMDWRDLQRFGRESKRRFCLDEESVKRLLRVLENVNPKCARLMNGGKAEGAEDAKYRLQLDRKKPIKRVHKVEKRTARRKVR